MASKQTHQQQPKQHARKQHPAPAAPRPRAKAAAIAEATRRTAQAVGEAGAEAAQTEGRAIHQTGDATAETLRNTGEAGAEILRQGGEAAGELARRGARTAAEAEQRLADAAAEGVEEFGRRVAQAVHETAGDMRRLMVFSGAGGSGGGFQPAQQAVAGLVDGVVQANLRITRALFRAADPAPAFDLQRRIARECLDGLLEGGATVLRAARQASEDTLRPLEAQIERRRNGGRVAEVMRRDPRVLRPNDTVQQAARLLGEEDEDTDLLPVGDGDRLVGTVTERDLALRAAAEGKDPARTRVREVMTREPLSVFADEGLDHAAETMTEHRLRRLPVVDRRDRLVGVVTLADVTAARRGANDDGEWQLQAVAGR